MPTSPYSLDLRNKVIKFLEAGNSQILASKVFALNISTVNRWYLRYRREGNYLPRKRPGAKSKINQEELISYIKINPDMKLQDLSKKLGISAWGVYYWLRKLGYRYKKKPIATWKLVKKSGIATQKR